MNKDLVKIIVEECMNLGLNTAHDYDGIETEKDLIIYTKAIIREYKKLINTPVETTNEEPIIKNQCSCKEPHHGFKIFSVCTDCNGIKDDKYWKKLGL